MQKAMELYLKNYVFKSIILKINVELCTPTIITLVNMKFKFNNCIYVFTLHDI